MITKYAAVWILLAMTATINGIVRQATYGKVLSDLSAHQLSTLTGVFATGVVAWGASRHWPLESARQAWTTGILWLILTVAFEFGFGHFVAGHPWARLFADYNLLEGRLWLLFLAWITVLPYLLFRYF